MRIAHRPTSPDTARRMEQRIGPEDGKLGVYTYREGVAQRVGPDLVIEVEELGPVAERLLDM
jgi:hypothetical protein